MASSSQVATASPPPSDACWKFDVFLSFRGADTRKGITVDLHDELNRRGIRTFMDDPDLKVGDAISRTLIQAIQGSRFAIVVLSQNYAFSTWCLEELEEICRSMEENRIFPLFYDVEPTDVRYQKQSFGEAFTKHEASGRYGSAKVKNWRGALNKVANISGWNTNDHKTHRELVHNIVEFLRGKLVPEAIESAGDFQEFEATRQAMDEIVKALEEDDVTVIGVYGMGGVGKTTLVVHVGVKVRSCGIFDCVTMVVVSQNLDFEKLQDALAEQLGFGLHEKTESGRAARLRKEIMRREKILIILDDIWQGIELSRIGIPSYKELRKCKCKLLFTTRLRNVCHVMECQEKITLNVLSEQDAWTLFVRKARRSFESPTFEDVAKKVARECKGLPIALITVARALGDKELVEWKRAAQRLEKSQTANPDDYGEASKCIKLSYDYLKDEEYKSYFLLCCLFPEDYDIPVEVLFRYAIGKGLFQDAETLREARERADSVARHLKYSSLLLDDRTNEFVRMHDVVRDAAIQIAESAYYGFLVKPGCRLEEWPLKLHEGYSAISLMRNYICKLPERLVCPKLQILLLNRNFFLEDFPETFFQTPNELRVLDLSFTSLSLLPHSFGLLTNLQVLDLSFTSLSLLPHSFSLLTNLRALYLDDLGSGMIDASILGKLKNLEILSMRNSCLKELPIGMGCLTNVRLLDITCPKIARIPSEVISKLHNLEELYMQGFREWGSKMEGEKEESKKTNALFRKFRRRRKIKGRFLNASFDEVTSLSKLRVLRVSTCDVECLPKYVEFIPKWIEFDIRIGGPCDPGDPYEMKPDRVTSFADKSSDRVNSILLELDFINRLPEWFWNEIMKLAERLHWDGCRERLIAIFVESEHGRLHGLKQLSIQGLEEDKELMDRIRLQESRRMVHRGGGSTRKPVFENLEELNLKELDCSDLCAVELAPRSLINLKILNIEGCYNWGNILLPSTLLQRLLNLEVIEYKCGCKENIDYVFGCEALLVSKQLKLRKISLDGLPTVSLCYGPAPPAMFQNLQSLYITNCNLRGSLFTYEVARCLSLLNHLELKNCTSLERIVEASNKKSILPKLKHLTLNNLPMLYCTALDIECPSLEELSISFCDRLQGSLFTDEVARCLSLLNHLILENCTSLERIVEASNKKSILPKLKHLTLNNLPMLYCATLDIECPSLEELSISFCDRLQGSLFTYDVARCLSLLNHFELRHCTSLERIVEVSNKKSILPKLKHLTLSNLPMLYYESATLDIECPSLEELSVFQCGRLQGSLFTYDVAQGLSQLNYLQLNGCLLLERIVEASNKKSILPKLKHLTLNNLPMLYCAALDIECPSLEELSVSRCGRLQGSLFTYDVAQGLSQLNCLELNECPLLERIVEASNKKTILPKLKRLSLTDLPMLYYERATFNVECPSLERLYVQKCPNFSASPSDFQSRKQVQL